MFQTVGCFNYMVILGQITPEANQTPFTTAYANFYSSMIKVPLFGQYYNRISPLFILIFGGIFALMSFFKYQNKALSTLKRYSRKINQKMEEVKAKGEEKAFGQKNISLQVQGKQMAESDMNLIDRILRGEKAILAEYDLMKKKEERNRMLRFN